MRPVAPFEFPPEQQEAFRKARLLEWISIGYILSSAGFLYLVMGTSQAMRTSWLEDMLSLVPPIAFLAGSRIAIQSANRDFPYGKHAAVSIGYLTASLALLGMGGYLFIEAAIKLIQGERTTIGGFNVLGTTIWAGWPMLVALAYTGIPSYFIGRAKKKLAPLIHDKVLYADAEMNRADWMAELAAAIGVVGTGFGFWWADATAAGLVSLDILRDGTTNIRAAVAELIDSRPKQATERQEPDPLPERLAKYLGSFDWILKADVRMREEGHVYFGEAFVVPATEERLVENIEDLVGKAKAFDWRVHDLTIMPVRAEVLEAVPGKALADESSQTRCEVSDVSEISEVSDVSDAFKR